jgi:hypothetical protein
LQSAEKVKHLNQTQLAERWDVAEATLERWRSDGIGPVFMKIQGRVHITADLPKKIEWDQARLADITQRIAANGDNPAEYVEISSRVSETKFNAWPESLKSSFSAARTLKTGKPGFRLALQGENK